MEDLYDVCRVADGALATRDVDLDTARDERARLNAEARVINPATGKPTGMYCGEVVSYEIRSKSGLCVK